jgi:hypothetical protein
MKKRISAKQALLEIYPFMAGLESQLKENAVAIGKLNLKMRFGITKVKNSHRESVQMIVYINQKIREILQ